MRTKSDIIKKLRQRAKKCSLSTHTCSVSEEGLDPHLDLGSWALTLKLSLV